MRWRCDIGFLWCWPLGWSVHCARHSHHCYHKIKQGELNNGSSTLMFYISVNVNLERHFPSGGPGCLYQSGLYAGEQKCHPRFLSDLLLAALCTAVQPLRAKFSQQNILFVQYDAPVQTVHGSTAHSAQPIKNISKMAPRVKIERRRHRSAFFLDRESLHEAPSESFSIGISLKL